MSLVKHAETELKIAGLFDEDSDYGGALATATMELIRVFENQGHSSNSASMVSNLFNTLSRYETLIPITGKDEEGGEPLDGMDTLQQNKRNSAVFKHTDTGYCTYSSSVIKRCPNGVCWSGPLYMTREDAINNTNIMKFKIKSFPFTPKTFYIDVLEEEIRPDDWIMWVKDPKQIEEVLAYYDKI